MKFSKWCYAYFYMAITSEPKHYWVYVLELNDNKYYVGLTTQWNAEKRIDQHKTGFFSAQWVKKHGYKKTLQIHDLGITTRVEAQPVEDILTRDLIKEHGLANVRGGDISYSGTYIPRLGRLFRDTEWESLTVVVLLMLVIVYFAIDKYLIRQ
jgi:predicted GIY-YIG superfamily endonuclease